MIPHSLVNDGCVVPTLHKRVSTEPGTDTVIGQIRLFETTVAVERMLKTTISPVSARAHAYFTQGS